MPEQKRGYFSTKKLDFSADGHRTFNPFLSVINGKGGGGGDTKGEWKTY